MKKQEFFDKLKKEMHGIHKEKIEEFLHIFEIIKVDLELFLNYLIQQNYCTIEYYFEKGNDQYTMHVSKDTAGVCFYNDKTKRHLRPEEVIKIFPELIYAVNSIG